MGSDYPFSQPIVVQPNAVPGGALERKVIVSPQHRLLLRGMNGREDLAPSKVFLRLPGVRRMHGRKTIEYISLMCARHEILNASGLAVESFLPGPQGFRRLAGWEIIQIRHALDRHAPPTAERDMSPARSCLGGSSGRRAVEQGGRLAPFVPLRHPGHDAPVEAPLAALNTSQHGNQVGCAAK